MKESKSLTGKEILNIVAWGVGGAIAAFVIGGAICCVLTWYPAPLALL